MMKTGFKDMKTIRDFGKGDFHRAVAVKAILEWVKDQMRQENRTLVHWGFYNKTPQAGQLINNRLISHSSEG